MKAPTFLLVSALSAAAAAGCGNITFDITQDFPETLIMGDPASTPLIGNNDAPLSLDIQAEAQKQHSGPASSARLKDLWFRITTPPNGTFYFLSAVTIMIVPTNPASRLPSRKIAERLTIPNENLIHITPIPGVDILPYSGEGAIIQATAIGRLPTEDTGYVGHVVVEVRI